MLVMTRPIAKTQITDYSVKEKTFLVLCTLDLEAN